MTTFSFGSKVTEVIIGAKPNTYTFTKALAENIIESEGEGLPIAIIRPSIVAAAWQDPFPGMINPISDGGRQLSSIDKLTEFFSGWVDNFNAATGVLAGAGKGILRTAFIK